MICTCTLNPSLDYYMEFEEPVVKNATNRSKMEYFAAGGKGINISIVLNNLAIPTRAFGFLGGFTIDYYIELLQKYTYVLPSFTYVDGATRINVKVNDGDDTDLNAMGPYITEDKMANLKAKVERLGEGDYFALAGNCPDYLEKDVITLLHDAIADKVRVVLDTNIRIMHACMKSGPFLVKTTKKELEQYCEKSLNTKKELLQEMVNMHNEGAKNVLLLSGHESIMVCDSGIYTCDILQEENIVNTVGMGDSLTGGFLMNYLRSSDSVDSFKFASCCTSATAHSKGLATREKIDSFYEKTEIKQIKNIEEVDE